MQWVAPQFRSLVSDTFLGSTVQAHRPLTTSPVGPQSRDRADSSASEKIDVGTYALLVRVPYRVWAHQHEPPMTLFTYEYDNDTLYDTWYSLVKRLKPL